MVSELYYSVMIRIDSVAYYMVIFIDVVLLKFGHKSTLSAYFQMTPSSENKNRTVRINQLKTNFALTEIRSSDEACDCVKNKLYDAIVSTINYDSKKTVEDSKQT